MNDTCPCCSQVLPATRQLQFYYPDVLYNGKLARLHPFEFRILQAGYRQRLSTRELADAVYADRSDGGPLHAADTLAVTIFRMNKKIKRLGLTYRSTLGRSCYYELKTCAQS